MTQYEVDILRKGFIEYTKNKNNSIKGRRDTFNSLVEHIKINMLEELSEGGQEGFDRVSFNEALKNRAKKEFNEALEDIL